ncbi:MAG: hypothetical protein OEM52_14670, partial [bacterium]|nr:hypothetical protein [bacterium]
MILRRLCSISVVLLSTLLLLLTANTAFAQDSSGVTCIGHVSFDWGSANSVTVSGDYAYVTSGRNGFWIVDVSDSIRPVEIGGADTPGYACGVAVAGDYAFIADSSYGIRIFNISIPSSPIAVGFYDTPGTAYSVVVSENFAYVADGTFGLRILDVTNPASPQQTGFFDTPGTALYLTISGNIVYIADGVGGLRIIDITNPSNPIEIGFYTIPWIYICKIVVQGNFAYLADYAGSLRVVDISNPVNPVPRGYYLETGEGSSTGNVGYDGLNVFSVSLSNNHAFISSEYYTGSTRPPYRFFDNCFLRTIDISNPDSLRQVRFSVYGYVEDRQYTGVINDLDVVRGTIYAASRSSGLCLRDTVNATLFASGLDKSVVDVAVARGFAYIALGNSIRQYNLTDLANQQCRFVYRTRSKPLSIVASDSFLYIADGSVFRIFACDDPNNISEIGSCITPYAITKITIYNDYAYLSAYTSGISIIDISNPTSPRLVDSADSPGQAWGIAVSGNSAFVADGESGIAIFDVSHPDSLRLIRVLDTPGFAS